MYDFLRYRNFGKSKDVYKELLVTQMNSNLGLKILETASKIHVSQ